MITANHKLFWGSSYDRGLDIVLEMWPGILEKFPDATLDIAYGWDLFDRGYLDNPERMAWKGKMNKLMEQPGINHHGRVGKQQLHQIRSNCGIWVYPTYFQEINCITALETQNDGLVPVTMDNFALKETVGSGFKISGDIEDKETKELWLEALFKLMADHKLWQEENKKAIAFAKSYAWENLAKQWETHFSP